MRCIIIRPWSQLFLSVVLLPLSAFVVVVLVVPITARFSHSMNVVKVDSVVDNIVWFIYIPEKNLWCGVWGVCKYYIGPIGDPLAQQPARK